MKKCFLPNTKIEKQKNSKILNLDNDVLYIFKNNILFIDFKINLSESLLNAYLHRKFIFLIYSTGTIAQFNIETKEIESFKILENEILAYTYLSDHNLYLINLSGKIYKGLLYDLKFKKLNLGNFCDRFDIHENNCNKIQNKPFDEFISKYITVELDTLYILDIYNRIYSFSNILILLHFSVVNIISFYYKDKILYYLTDDDQLNILSNCVIDRFLLKNPKKIVNDQFVMCKTGLYNIKKQTY
ncbi:hypothetical protein GVAV_000487 [Gurleya vavrai]